MLRGLREDLRFLPNCSVSKGGESADSAQVRDRNFNTADPIATCAFGVSMGVASGSGL